MVASWLGGNKPALPILRGMGGQRSAETLPSLLGIPPVSSQRDFPTKPGGGNHGHSLSGGVSHPIWRWRSDPSPRTPHTLTPRVSSSGCGQHEGVRTRQLGLAGHPARRRAFVPNMH